jgi:predicted RNase H-like HicB family nuclease
MVDVISRHLQVLNNTFILWICETMLMSVTAYKHLVVPGVAQGDPTYLPYHTYTIDVVKDEDGCLVATCAELPGLVTQGKDTDEVERKALEAVKLMLEGTPDDNKEFKIYVNYKDSG